MCPSMDVAIGVDWPVPSFIKTGCIIWNQRVSVYIPQYVDYLANWVINIR